MVHIPQPALSVELFENIIQELAVHPPFSAQGDHKHHQNRLRNLTQCALVCRKFASICKPHIFAHLHNMGTFGREGRRLLCFTKYAKENPDVLPLVRMLTLNLKDGYGPYGYAHKYPEMEEALSALTLFPRLHTLDIEFTDWDLDADGDDRVIRLAFLNAYLPKGTLRALYFDRLPQDTVLKSIGLIDLKVRDVGRHPFTVDRETSSSLERLEVNHGYYDGGRYTVNSLDQCERLTQLILHAKEVVYDPLTHSSADGFFDSSKLKILSIVDLTPFYDFCKNRQQQHYPTRKIFQQLEHLDVDLVKHSCVQALQAMLQDTSSLRLLHVKVSCEPEPFYLVRLRLRDRFSDGTLKNVTDLKLEYDAFDDDGYMSALDSLESIFLAASTQNTLERIHITIKFHYISVRSSLRISVPPFTDLNTVRDIVGNNVTYRALKSLEFSFSFNFTGDIPDSYSSRCPFEYPKSANISIRQGRVELVQMDL